MAMKLMAMTFVRISELIGARWEEFDSQNARWDIPSERMKMHTLNIVLLSRQAVQLLQTLHTLAGIANYCFRAKEIPTLLCRTTPSLEL